MVRSLSHVLVETRTEVIWDHKLRHFKSLEPLVYNDPPRSSHLLRACRRAWQQLQVLWRFTFEGWKLMPDRVKVLKETYSDLDSLGAKTTAKVEQHANCAFCRAEQGHFPRRVDFLADFALCGPARARAVLCRARPSHTPGGTGPLSLLAECT